MSPACSPARYYLARPTTVVELGSGGSSLVIGEQLRRLGGGHLYTLDHDPEYAEKTRHMVDSLGLESWVTVLDAPLVDQEVSGDRFRWYDVPREVRDLAVIDVLIVDGPPQLTDVEGTPATRPCRFPRPALDDRARVRRRWIARGGEADAPALDRRAARLDARGRDDVEGDRAPAPDSVEGRSGRLRNLVASGLVEGVGEAPIRRPQQPSDLRPVGATGPGRALRIVGRAAIADSAARPRSRPASATLSRGTS